MVKTSLVVVVTAAVGCSASALLAQRGNDEARQALIARGKSLELPTKYVPPPGEKIEHYASGYAKIMCTAVFVTGLDPAFAAENVGYFTAPYAERAKLGLSDTLIRLSPGCEHHKDLVADLLEGLAAVGATREVETGAMNL